MKKITTLFIALFAIVTAFAQNNNLVVFSEGGERFYLILNGIRQNVKPETNVKVTGLNAANYKAKIIFESQGIPDHDQNVYLMWEAEQGKNMEFTYILKKKKDNYKLAMLSQAPINVDAAPAPNQTIIVHTTTEQPVIPAPPVNNTATTTTTTTTTTAPTTTTTTGTTDNVSIGMNVNGVGMNMNVNINDGTGMTGTSTSTTTSSTTYSSTVTTSGTGTYTEPAPTSTTTTTTSSSACVNPMGSSDFAEAKKSISSKSFEDSKITMAKQIIKANCLSTMQVKEIMMLFSFEETKLDLAKFAYNRTTDTNNYYKLNDAFTFETSIEELDKYVESQKK